MRIGLVAPPWLPVPPERYGGTESVLDRLARGLVDAGHEVLLAAPGDSSCPVPRVAGLRVADPVRMGQSAVEIPYTLQAYSGLGDVDVVHDHTLAGPLCVQPLPPMPMVTTNHGPFDADLDALYAAMAARGVAVVAISRHHATTAGRTPVTTVIHHGIDVEEVPVGRGDGGYACVLARMVPDKGIREAVLVARRAGLPLRIAAKMHDALEKQYYEEVVRPLLGGDVEYLGEVSAEEKYALLGGAVALVNPLRWPEPFGLVMIEALACGTPVVATPCGSVPEIVEDGVTGFVRDGVPALAAALTEVDGLRRTRCRQAAEQRFSTARMVRDHLHLYERLVAARTRRVAASAVPVSALARPGCTPSSRS